MKLSLKELAGTNVLAGALAGRRLLGELLGKSENEPAGPEPVFLDFSGIDVATASFLRESVLAFRDFVRSRRSNLYPVIANANQVVRDELIELVRLRGDVLMTCTIDHAGEVKGVGHIGDLDPKQQVTFELVRQHGETDASELMREYGEGEGVKQTAWNNRLAALADRGLVVETSRGRAKRYKPLFEGT